MGRRDRNSGVGMEGEYYDLVLVVVLGKGLSGCGVLWLGEE
jgi:hypothetical protein